jgi:hypothetical protein
MAELILALADIADDDRYSFTYPHLPERYAGLAEKFPGLPLLVVDQARRVVYGHDLLLLLRQRREARVDALQIDLGPAEALLLNYNILNLLFGLNAYEKLLFVKKISRCCPLAEIRRRTEADFALNESLLQRLEILLAEPFRAALASGHLGLKAALKAADMAAADRVAAIGLMRGCKFSDNQQALILQWLEEIAFREKKALAPILAAAGLDLLLEKEMPQKKILDVLQQLRFPQLTRAELEWQHWQKKMSAAGVSLAHSPMLAEQEVRVTMTLKDRAQAEKLLAKLKKIG